MSRSLLNPRVLFLLCLVILLTGCQHPLAPSAAGGQPAGMNYALLDAQATARVQKAMQWPAPILQAQACVAVSPAPESPNPDAQPPADGAQKAPECLTGQLADGLMLVFETFTGRSHAGP